MCAHTCVHTCVCTPAHTCVVLCLFEFDNRRMMYAHYVRICSMNTSMAHGFVCACTHMRQRMCIQIHVPYSRISTYQATADIRAAEVKRGAKSQLTIIGVTGATSKDDEIKCRKAGMTDMITKPVTREHLRTKIKEWVDKMQQVHF